MTDEECLGGDDLHAGAAFQVEVQFGATLTHLEHFAARGRAVCVRGRDFDLHGRTIVKGNGQQAVCLAGAADRAPGDDLGELLVGMSHGNEGYFASW